MDNKSLDIQNIEFSLNKISEERVREAEKILGVIFASDYRTLLLEYGRIDYNGHEITGITSSSRMSVTNTTLSERDKNAAVSNNMYVVEKTGFDGIVIWQDEDGSIYETVDESLPTKIFDSLAEYLNEIC